MEYLPAPVGVANLATRWHEVPLPPLKGEVPNEREAEGFCALLTNKPLSFAALSSSPFRGAKAATSRPGRQVGDPYSRLCKTMGLHHSSKDTPSVSPFGLPAPSEREPRRLRRSGRLRASPTWRVLLCNRSQILKRTGRGADAIYQEQLPLSESCF